jgi:hypothetical protein
MELDTHITIDCIFIDPGDTILDIESFRNEHILCSVFGRELFLDLSREFFRELEFGHHISE